MRLHTFPFEPAQGMVHAEVETTSARFGARTKEDEGKGLPTVNPHQKQRAWWRHV